MATLVKTWTFRSNSNPNKTYETSQYDDGSTSCQCKGWCIARGGVRSCTHTRKVEQGIADQEAVSVWTDDRFHLSVSRASQMPATEVTRLPTARQKKVRQEKKAMELPKRIVNWR
jgi:hypothetical protein